MAGNDEHRQAELRRESMHVDHVEARERDALQEHGAQLRPKRTGRHQVDDAPRCVCAVSAYGGREDSVQSRLGAYGAHDADSAAVSAIEGRIVESDHVADGTDHLSRISHGKIGRVADLFASKPGLILSTSPE